MAKEAMDDWAFDKLLGSINMVGYLNLFSFFQWTREAVHSMNENDVVRLTKKGGEGEIAKNLKKYDKINAS